MKKTFPFIILLAVLSCISGYLMSKASWIGRVGMTFFYKEYNFMKIWWQGAIAVFLVLMVFFTLQSVIYRRMSAVGSRLVQLLILAFVCAGAYFTYNDFHHDISHRMLGHRFHYGFYIFWISWLLICLFLLFKKKRISGITTTKTDKTETIND